MGLIAAKCTQCGANIEVDETKEAGICQYCGTAFITEKAINNYNITNHISNLTVNIHNSSNENLFEIDVHKLISYKGESKIVEVPNHITVIGEKAFHGNNKVEKIILPDSVMIIESWAISNCKNLKEIIIPDSVTTIHPIAFSNCKSLEEIVIPNSVTTIGAMAFGGCENLKKVVLPTNLQVIKVNLFLKCISLENVVLPNELVLIESECFAYCSALKEIVIPKSVKKIIGFPFLRCDLDRIIFEDADNVEEITDSLFYMSKKMPEVIASENFKKKFGKYLTISEFENASACYIATCVYGSYDCPQVWTLRRFRDYILDVTWYGRLFIKCYYVISPIVVKWFGETKWFKRFWKSRLDKMVSKLNNKGVEDTRYQDKY